MTTYICRVTNMLGLPPYPYPERLLTPPWTVYFDDIQRCWVLQSPNKPKNAPVYGIVWEINNEY